MYIHFADTCTVNITSLLLYERNQCPDTQYICDLFNEDNKLTLSKNFVSVLAISNPFEAESYRFVLHAEPLRIWKNDDTPVHIGELTEKDFRLENDVYEMDGDAIVQISPDTSGVVQGGYVYVIDGQSGRYLCTLDYLYCLYNNIGDMEERNPFSISQVTGKRPVSRAISNGLYWQKLITSEKIDSTLYYSDQVGNRYAEYKDSLYFSVGKYIPCNYAYDFGVALAYVIDEAFDLLDGAGRCNCENEYFKLFGSENTSINAHYTLWCITRRQLNNDIIQNAMCLYFTPSVYNEVMQKIEDYKLPSGPSDEENEIFVFNDVEKTVLYPRIYPFATKINSFVTEPSHVTNGRELRTSKKAIAYLNSDVEGKMMNNPKGPISLKIAKRVFTTLADDLLHYLYTPSSDVFSKRGVNTQPVIRINGDHLYLHVTHECDEWDESPKNAMLLLCRHAQKEVITKYNDPVEPLNDLLFEKFENVKKSHIWNSVFNYAIVHYRTMLFKTIIVACTRMHYIYVRNNKTSQYKMGVNIDYKMRSHAVCTLQAILNNKLYFTQPSKAIKV